MDISKNKDPDDIFSGKNMKAAKEKIEDILNSPEGRNIKQSIGAFDKKQIEEFLKGVDPEKIKKAAEKLTPQMMKSISADDIMRMIKKHNGRG